MKILFIIPNIHMGWAERVLSVLANYLSENNNVKIPVLGAYFNPVHSDKAKVKAGQAKFADHLKKASLLGAK